MPFLGSWCPQCGSNVSVDEDGCCNACGCSAVGQGADEAHATIASLRSRLALMAEHVCEECGCAAVDPEDHTTCEDCYLVGAVQGRRFISVAHKQPQYTVGACVSAGMRRLCGRRILEGVE